MKRYSKWFGGMYEMGNGHWVKFDDYDLDVNSAIVMNDQQHARLIVAEEINNEMFAKMKTLEFHYLKGKELIKTKEDQIGDLYATISQRDVDMHGMTRRHIQNQCMIWLVCVPTIITLGILVGLLK